MRRIQGQSLLDYLWVNYGDRFVTNEETSDPLAIPSYTLMLSLLEKVCNKSVGSISLEGTNLIIKSIEGNRLGEIDIAEIVTQGTTIAGFGRKSVSLSDKDNNCPYDLYTLVYYLRLSDGTEYLAPIDVYKGGTTKTISNTILDDTIYSDLKISTLIKGVIFSKEEDGLSGLVFLQGSNNGIHFAVMELLEYDNTPHRSNTLYFIKGASYLYFNDKMIGGGDLKDFEEVMSRLNNLENLITWEYNG